ncbi:hypothetical protein JYP52_01630 [Nitratireductor aquibiodomus]|uniref:hypothetical protein n=1 Tax=Nitratireductor aquibiodomus TaxID=204799 RepID=UPI0019D410A4|nr:hypothetical protein [Nitratireductor aquibiodomus]MBN7759824.1 hypothetical protein [Nitratireductor aquibiodomus]
MKSNIQPLVLQLINLKAKMEPLEHLYEKTKTALRGAGADTYHIAGKGTVTVSEPSVAKPKGTKVVLDDTALEAAPAKLKSELFRLGILKIETIYTRASKARVEVKLEETMEVPKAA